MSELSSDKSILNAAKVEFAEYGLHGARIDRIAKLSGLNKAMIYYHFESKESLYEHVIKDITEGILDATIRKVQEMNISSEEKIYQFITEFGPFFYKMEAGLNFRIFLQEIISGGKYFRNIVIPNYIEPIYNTLTDLIQKAKDNKDISEWVRPEFLFMQIIGGTVFFNMVRHVLDDTPVHKKVFSKNNPLPYFESMIKVLQRGIKEKKED